jgi:hypothetical protein
MKQDKMSAAKMHYEQLMSALAALGMSLEQFQDEMDSEEPEEMEEEGGEYSEGMEEAPEGVKQMPSKSKIAILVAKMKNKKKD